MEGSAQDVLFVLGVFVAAVLFVGVVWALNSLVSPRKPTPEKALPYECGMDPAGDPWAPVDLKFSTLALLFVIFDAEAALMFAVAVKLQGSVAAVIEVGIFAGFLLLGLVYAWRKGALQWQW
ncbi:MAG: NADH-quinone oxidoreductase subunit A [Coriobacteriia bacterium]